MPFGLSFAQFAVIISGVALAVAGILEVLFGILLAKILPGVDILGSKFSAFSLFIIIYGVIIFLASGLGFYSALMESRQALRVYIVVLGVLVLGQLFAGAYLIVEWKDLHGYNESEIHRELEAHFHGYNNSADSRKIVDRYQKGEECCGMNNASFWKQIPKSCCKSVVPVCTVDVAYTEGCADHVTVKIFEMLILCGGFAVACVVVELVAATFASFMNVHSTKARRTKRRAKKIHF